MRLHFITTESVNLGPAIEPGTPLVRAEQFRWYGCEQIRLQNFEQLRLFALEMLDSCVCSPSSWVLLQRHRQADSGE